MLNRERRAIPVNSFWESRYSCLRPGPSVFRPSTRLPTLDDNLAPLNSWWFHSLLYLECDIRDNVTNPTPILGNFFPNWPLYPTRSYSKPYCSWLELWTDLYILHYWLELDRMENISVRDWLELVLTYFIRFTFSWLFK